MGDARGSHSGSVWAVPSMLRRLLASCAKASALTLSRTTKALRLASWRNIQTSSMRNLGVGLAALAFAVMALTIWSFRLDALNEARQQSTALATAVAEQATRALHAVDLVIRDVQDLVSNMGLEKPETFNRALSTPDMHLLLHGKLARLPQADAVVLVSTDGSLVSSS